MPLNLVPTRQPLGRNPLVQFGCSYTFGVGLNDGETLPQAFADSVDHKQRVLNLGFAGYGPAQFLSELQSGIFDSVIGPQPKLFVFLTSVAHAVQALLGAPRPTLRNRERPVDFER